MISKNYKLKIEKIGEKKFLYLNKEFITYKQLILFSRTLNKNDIIEITVSFQRAKIIDGVIIYQNMSDFIEKIHVFAAGKIPI